MKAIILYYSRTGNTKNVAERIALRLHADVQPIKPHVRYRGPLGYLIAGMQTLFSKKNEHDKNTGGEDLSVYDLIILGAPVWASRIPPPMRSFLISNQHKFKRYAYFCTQDKSGADRVFRLVQKQTKREPIATLAISKSMLETGRSEEATDSFCSLIESKIDSPWPDLIKIKGINLRNR